MKKVLIIIISIILIVGIVIGIVKISEKSDNVDIDIGNNNIEEEIIFNLQEVYDNILKLQPEDKEELVLFLENNEDLIEGLYVGLKDISIKEKMIYMHPIGMACEIALVEVENKEDLEKVKDIFEARIEIGKEAAMCDSESQDIWRRRAQIQQKGNYICMIVLPDDYIIPENIF